MNLFYPEAEIDDDLLNRKIEMLVRVIVIRLSSKHFCLQPFFLKD